MLSCYKYGIPPDCKDCEYQYVSRSGDELCQSPQDHDAIAGTIPRGYKLCSYNRKHGCGESGNWYKGKV